MKGIGKSATEIGRTTLSQVGINRHDSSKFRRIASIPEEKFEEHINKTIKVKEELTTSEFLKYSTKLNQENNRSNQHNLFIIPI